MISLGKQPVTWFKCIELNKELELCLFIIEYQNTVVATVYQSEPRTGSLSLATPRLPFGSVPSNQDIFRGRESHLSMAIAEMLANTLNKICIASVNLTVETGIEISILKKLIDEYFSERNNNRSTKSKVGKNKP